MLAPTTTTLISNNRPEEIPSAGKHMARPRCFLSEGNPYEVTIMLLKNLSSIRTLQQSIISPSRYPNWTLPQKCSWDNFDWDWIALMSEPNITIQSLSNLSPTAHQIQLGNTCPIYYPIVSWKWSRASPPIRARKEVWRMISREWVSKSGTVQQKASNLKLMPWISLINFFDFPSIKTSDLSFPPWL